jgi:hypothetical protein
MVNVITAFQVSVDRSVDGRGGLQHVAYFTSKPEAEEIGEQTKGKNKHYVSVRPVNIVIFDTAEEFLTQKPIEQIKKEGLAKLTETEKVALGLSV